MASAQELKMTGMVVKAILDPFANGLALNDFLKDYQAQEGRPLPVSKFGCRNPLEFLRKLTESVLVVELDDGSTLLKAKVNSKTSHISDMVKKQKPLVSKAEKQGTHLAKKAAQQRIPTTQPKAPRMKSLSPEVNANIIQIIGTHPKGVSLERLKREYRSLFGQPLELHQHGLSGIPDLVAFMGPMVKVGSNESGALMIGPSANLLKSLAPATRSPIHPPSRNLTQPPPHSSCLDMVSPPLPGTLKEKLRRLLADFPRGMNMDHFLPEFKKAYGRELDIREYDPTFVSVVQFCTSHQDIFQVKQVGRTYFCGSLQADLKSRGVPPGAADSTRDPKESSGQVKAVKASPPPGKLHSLIRVLQDFIPDGLDLKRFNEEYAKRSGQTLSIAAWGFDSLQDLFESIPEHVTLKYDKYSRLKVLLTPQHHQLSPPLLLTGSVGIKSQNLSHASESMAEALDVQELPSNLKIGDAIEIVIGEVFSPSRFYVQLKSTHSKLDSLMAKLDQFYNDPLGSNYTLDPIDFLGGQLVALPYGRDRNWHRGLIRKLRDRTTAEVFFVDFGTVQRENMEDMRYLIARFAELPAQAILARCAGVRPLESETKWSQSACQRFFNLLTDAPDSDVPPLLGLYRGVCMVSRVQVSLDIIDTALREHPKGLNIARALIKEHLAEEDPDAIENDAFQVDPFQKHHPFSVPNSAPLPPLRRVGEPFKTPLPQDPPGRSWVPPSTAPPFRPMGGQHAPSIPLPTPRSPRCDSSISVTNNPSPAAQRCVEQVQAPDRLSASSVIYVESSLSSSSSLKVVRLNKIPVHPSAALVQDVRLTPSHSLHIVNLNGEAMATSGGISRLFKWKGQDLLLQFMELKQLEYKRFIVRREDCEPFFEKCLIEKVPGIFEEEKKLAVEIHLHLLKDVPFMIKACNPKPDPDLLRALNREIAHFNPRAACWTE